MSVLSSKNGKLFAKLSGSLSASALLKGNYMLKNTDVTKINFQCMKFLLADLSADCGFAKCNSANKNAHMKLRTPAQAPRWHFTHPHSPESTSQPSKAERLLKLTVRMFACLTKSVPCKNKQKTPHEGKTVDFSPYCF